MTDSQPDLVVVWLSGVTMRLEKWRGSEGSAFLGFEGFNFSLFGLTFTRQWRVWGLRRLLLQIQKYNKNKVLLYSLEV